MRKRWIMPSRQLFSSNKLYWCITCRFHPALKKLATRRHGLRRNLKLFSIRKSLRTGCLSWPSPTTTWQSSRSSCICTMRPSWATARQNWLLRGSWAKRRASHKICRMYITVQSKRSTSSFKRRRIKRNSSALVLVSGLYQRIRKHRWLPWPTLTPTVAAGEISKECSVRTALRVAIESGVVACKEANT